MKSQIVRCEDGGKEGAWIVFLIAAILLFGWLMLPYNQVFQETSTLAKHQVSIQTLAPKQLTMVADLRLAHEEIRDIYLDTEQWATVEALEQSWLAPFVKDKSWIHQGQHHWKQVAEGVYQGVPETGSDRFLLISRQQKIELWLDTLESASLLRAQDVPQDSALLAKKLNESGWQQVVFQHEEKHSH